MTVISHALDRRGATGKSTAQKREYEASYLIRTDDPLDGPQLILDYCAANLPNPDDSSPYVYGNDDDQLAFCVEMAHEGRDPKDGTVHRVKMRFTTEDSSAGGGIDSSGNPTNNPLDFRPDIQTGYQMVQRPVWKALYISGYTGGMAGLFAGGEELCPMSSAWGTFDPPLEKEVALQRVSITINTQTWDNTDANTFVGKINSAPLQFKLMSSLGYGDLVWTLLADTKTLKLNDYKPVLKRETVEIGGDRVKLDYISVTAEVLIDPAGWDEEVPDIDWHRKAVAGDPNGRGGTLSLTDLVDGMARDDVIRGPGGDPAARKQLLNGDGQPILNAEISDVIWLRWQKYSTRVMTLAPVLSTVFESP